MPHGTSGLNRAKRALDIGPGTEVIVTELTKIATPAQMCIAAPLPSLPHRHRPSVPTPLRARSNSESCHSCGWAGHPDKRRISDSAEADGGDWWSPDPVAHHED